MPSGRIRVRASCLNPRPMAEGCQPHRGGKATKRGLSPPPVSIRVQWRKAGSHASAYRLRASSRSQSASNGGRLAAGSVLEELITVHVSIRVQWRKAGSRRPSSPSRSPIVSIRVQWRKAGSLQTEILTHVVHWSQSASNGGRLAARPLSLPNVPKWSQSASNGGRLAAVANVLPGLTQASQSASNGGRLAAMAAMPQTPVLSSQSASNGGRLAAFALQHLTQSEEGLNPRPMAEGWQPGVWEPPVSIGKFRPVSTG